ncbi:hypothetical protein HQQ81_22175 [Microbacteriaceae bacterium VKM Ac-2854]|nr:hypothetical protein [Microbacteriaceae bacterium VKM Ac-2854]
MTAATRLAPPSPEVAALIEELIAALRAADNLNAGFIEHLCGQLRAVLPPDAE